MEKALGLVFNSFRRWFIYSNRDCVFSLMMPCIPLPNSTWRPEWVSDFFLSLLKCILLSVVPLHIRYGLISRFLPLHEVVQSIPFVIHFQLIFSSPNRFVPVSKSRKIKTFHLSPIKVNVVSTGQAGNSFTAFDSLIMITSTQWFLSETLFQLYCMSLIWSMFPYEIK